MITNVKASSAVVAPAGSMIPFNYGHQKALSLYPNFSIQLNQEQQKRRDVIFRFLIRILREERFEPSEDPKFLDLVIELPKLDHSRNFGSMDQDQLWKLGVCSVPNFILNALACQQLQRIFGDLSVCGCFYKINGCWRLDLDEKLSKRGLLMPLRSSKTGWIYALKVFRYPDDPKPFILKLRGGLNG